MEILGLIPARGGSKAIRHKNITALAGRPLLAYTCEAALASQRLTRVVLSTDDPAIAEVGRQSGVEVPFLRPVDLAQDDTPMLEVIQHALRTLEEGENYRPKAVVLLQPTSPLRRAEHIDAAVNILLEAGADSVVSVIEVPHHFNPVSLMRLEGGRLVPFVEGPLILRRQDKPVVYARNGPAVLVSSYDTLMTKNDLYGSDCWPYLMDAYDSIDIDSPVDLAIAEALLAQKAGKETGASTGL